MSNRVYAVQNSGMYSQNVEVVKGDVYQYMTLPATMKGWYDRRCKVIAFEFSAANDVLQRCYQHRPSEVLHWPSAGIMN